LKFFLCFLVALFHYPSVNEHGLAFPRAIEFWVSSMDDDDSYRKFPGPIPFRRGPSKPSGLPGVSSLGLHGKLSLGRIVQLRFVCDFNLPPALRRHNFAFLFFHFPLFSQRGGSPCPVLPPALPPPSQFAPTRSTFFSSFPAPYLPFFPFCRARVLTTTTRWRLPPTRFLFF